MKRIICLCSVLLLSAAAMFAQSGFTVKSVVEDDYGPVVGATVLEKGTGNGTATGLNGEFSLTVASRNATIEVSYMGYVKQSFAAAKVPAKIILVEDAEVLDDVVVIGYGVVKKQDATGSVTAIKPDDMNKGLVTNAQDMLVGKISGVSVTTSDGTPGAGATIRIRGGSSLTASNDPLIVIDGLAMDNEGVKGVSNALAMVNPNDIETFTVLKDASATAIYGSRASNGVIIITTKKGSEGQKPKVTYSGNVTTSVLTKQVDVMSASELKHFVLEELNYNDYADKFGNADTNWQDEIYRTAISTDQNVSITGSTKNMPYRISLGYTDQNGIVKTSGMQRVTASVNVSPTFLDKHLTLNVNAKGMLIHSRFSDGVQGAANDMDPTQPIHADIPGFGGWYQRVVQGFFNDAEGTALGDKWFYTNNTQSSANPVATLMQKDNAANSRAFVGNIEADYKIHGFEDLRLHANVGGDFSYGKQTLDISPYSFSDHYWGRYGYEQKNKYNLMLNTYAQYYKDLTADQHIDAMVGYEWQHFYNDGDSDYYGIYQPTCQAVDGEGNALANQKYNVTTNEWATESYLVSFFGRANWTAWNQLMLTATVRFDGSSRFAPENRWGVFPSVALGWKIKEAFLKDVDAINDLKLRLGYGITGQQNINQGDYPYMPTYSISREYAWSTLGEKEADVDPATLQQLVANGMAAVDGGTVYYRTYRPNVYNPDLTWEKTTTYNAGIDFGLLNNRITGAIDYYYRVTDDLINEVDIPAGTNFKTRAIMNVGQLVNKGVEFSINAVAIDNRDLKWDVSFNATHNQNEITKLTTGEGEGYYISTGDISNGKKVQAHAVGQPARSFYVYKTGRTPDGALAIYDLSGPNGKPDGTIDELDKYFAGSPDADLLLGFTSKWQYKGFDLGMTWRASIGNQIYNRVLDDNMQNVTKGTVYDAKCGGYHNILWSAYNAYYKDGVHRADFTEPDLLDYFIEDGSFVRCDNITLGYTPKFKKLGARFYCTVSNPFLFTGYKGLDPEIYSGIDNNIYPRSLSVIVGTTINF